MRPTLWLARLRGEFPGWRIAHLAEATDRRPAGWYAMWPTYNERVYAEATYLLRRRMASVEARRRSHWRDDR